MSAHSNRLAVLAADVRTAHQEITRGALAIAVHALAAGRMLVEAKASVAHGEWSAWLTEQAGLNNRTARRYMQLARSGLETATVADLGVKGSAARLARARVPRPPEGYWAQATWRREIMALIWRPKSEPSRFHVVVCGRINGRDHSINTTDWPIPDEMLSLTVAEAGFPIGRAPFLIKAMEEGQAGALEAIRGIAFQ